MDIQGIIHYQLLDNNEKKINAGPYRQQLRRLKTALDRKRPSLINQKEVILHYDNAGPHTTRLTKDLLEVIDFE